MTLCLFIENILHKLSTLSHCLGEKQKLKQIYKKQVNYLVLMWTTKKLGWMAHVSIFWAFPALWGVKTSIIFCLSTILKNQHLNPAVLTLAGLLQWKQWQNLHPVCWVGSPHTLTSALFLMSPLAAFFLKKHGQLQETLLLFEKANLAGRQEFSFKVTWNVILNRNRIYLLVGNPIISFSTGISGCIH